MKSWFKFFRCFVFHGHIQTGIYPGFNGYSICRKNCGAGEEIERQRLRKRK